MQIPFVHSLGQGFGVMWQPSVRADHPDLDVEIELDLAVIDGRLGVERFTALRREGGPPVTVDALKSVPLVSLVASSSQGGLLSGLVKVETTKGGATEITPVVGELEELTQVERAALVYRLAYFLNMPPTAAVAEDLGVSHAVAAKRVQAARRDGLLEPTTRGKKGT